MTVRLRPLRDDEFDEYVARGKASYANDMVTNAGLAREIAEQKAEQDWVSLLPDRTASPGQFLYAIETVDGGERVGDLWFAEREVQEGTVAFVYAIEVSDRFRGRGYGKAAM